MNFLQYRLTNCKLELLAQMKYHFTLIILLGDSLMLPFFADCYQLCSSSRCLGPFSSTYLYYYYLLLYFLHSKIPPPCIFLTCEVQLYCKMYVYSRNLPDRLNHEFSVDRKSKKNVRRVWRYQRGNQNLSVGRKKALKKSLKIPKGQSESNRGTQEST